MKIQIEHERAGFLRSVIETIKDLYLEGYLTINHEGITLQTMDPSRVSLVQCQLSASEFNVFDCREPCQLGVSFVDLYKILKCANTSDQLRLTYNGGTILKLVFAGRTNAKFDLTLTNPEDTSSVSIPSDIAYTYTEEMQSSEFQRVVKSLLQFTSFVNITKNKDGLNFVSGRDGTTGSHKGSFQVPSLVPVTQDYQESFNLKYLEHFTKCAALSDKMTLRLKSSIPLCVACNFGEESSILFYLAPKLDDSE